MGQALYRKYRSASFDEVIGQEHIVTTLKNSLKSGRVNHAYLLTGPRGVGKTSVARLLAYGVNGLSYDEGANHLDIIEIDAASNRRIDEIRDLREKVHIAPTTGKYKVYIIDEVHMLTREAFNALLKTLEEPPEHVIFILATTEAHKLPDTIISRCLRFTFRPIDNDQLAKHLSSIAKKESLNIDAEATELIARHGEGSFRDSISLLDQIKSIGSNITVLDVERALGIASIEQINQLLQTIKAGDPRAFDEMLQTAYDYGANEANLAKQIAQAVRADMIGDQQLFTSSQSLELLRNLLDVPGSRSPRAKLELVLLDLLFQNREPSHQSTPKPTATQEQNTPADLEKEIDQNIEAKNESEKPPRSDRVEQEALAEPVLKVITPESSELWQNTLQKLKTTHNTLYSIARMAIVDVDNSTINIVFKFAFHFKRMNEDRNKRVLAKVIHDLGHKDMVIQISLAADEPFAELPSSTVTTAESNPDVTTINNIFGGHEVLES